MFVGKKLLMLKLFGSGRCWESAVSSRWIGLSFHNR